MRLGFWCAESTLNALSLALSGGRLVILVIDVGNSRICAGLSVSRNSGNWTENLAPSRSNDQEVAQIRRILLQRRRECSEPRTACMSRESFSRILFRSSRWAQPAFRKAIALAIGTCPRQNRTGSALDHRPQGWAAIRISWRAKTS